MALGQLLRIPWTSYLTNEEVIRRGRVGKQLQSTVKKRKVSYLGHMLRGSKYSIPKLTLQEKIKEMLGSNRKQHTTCRFAYGT